MDKNHNISENREERIRYCKSGEGAIPAFRVRIKNMSAFGKIAVSKLDIASSKARDRKTLLKISRSCRSRILQGASIHVKFRFCCESQGKKHHTSHIETSGFKFLRYVKLGVAKLEANRLNTRTHTDDGCGKSVTCASEGKYVGRPRKEGLTSET